MFERYTEKARRVIFFSRYEASQYGSHYIEAEHLLLGLMREDKRLMLTFFPAGAGELARRQVDEAVPKRPQGATSVDLPLGEDAKKVLKNAADEADGLSDRHIGCEHLLLGLLRDKDHLAAKILAGFELELDAARERIKEMPERDLLQRVHDQIREAQERRSSIIRLHGEIHDGKRILHAVKRCCEVKFHWQRQTWKPRDAVVERKTGKVSLDLALADDAGNFELAKDGWKKDYCAICRWELHEAEDDHGTGYFNGRDWICTECYEKFWERPNFVAGAFGEIT